MTLTTLRPTLPVLGLTLAFILACTGDAGVGRNTAGDNHDTQLDDTAPPTQAEPPSLQVDRRCDWLGRPYASTRIDRTYVLRSTDHARDCNGENTAHSKIIFSLEGGQARPLLNVSELSDVRVLELDDALLVLADDDIGEHAWRLSMQDGSVLDEVALQVPIAEASLSPDGAWVLAYAPNRESLRLLDPVSLALQPFHTAVHGHVWLPDGQLATIEFTEDGAQLATWDLSGETLPITPTRSAELPGVTRSLFGSSAHDMGNGILAFEAQQPSVVLWDLNTLTVQEAGNVFGTLGRTSEHLVGDHANGVQFIDAFGGSMVFDTDLDNLVATQDSKNLLLANTTTTISWLDTEAGVVHDLGLGTGIDMHTLRGPVVFVADRDGLLRIDLDTGEAFQDVDRLGRHPLWLPVVDQLLLTASSDASVDYLDPVTLMPIESIDFNGDIVTPSALRPL